MESKFFSTLEIVLRVCTYCSAAMFATKQWFGFPSPQWTGADHKEPSISSWLLAESWSQYALGSMSSRRCRSIANQRSLMKFRTGHLLTSWNLTWILLCNSRQFGGFTRSLLSESSCVVSGAPHSSWRFLVSNIKLEVWCEQRKRTRKMMIQKTRRIHSIPIKRSKKK